MGPMHPYDLILWLTSVGLNLILGVTLYLKSQSWRERIHKAEVAANVAFSRYEKIKGPGNPQITIMEQHKQIDELKAQLNGETPKVIKPVPREVLKEITGK
tara:strand:- start:173 stop:475 length:303 start_codon:yes stop_codon:yes gene_type:complete